MLLHGFQSRKRGTVPSFREQVAHLLGGKGWGVHKDCGDLCHSGIGKLCRRCIEDGHELLRVHVRARLHGHHEKWRVIPAPVHGIGTGAHLLYGKGSREQPRKVRIAQVCNRGLPAHGGKKRDLLLRSVFRVHDTRHLRFGQRVLTGIGVMTCVFHGGGDDLHALRGKRGLRDGADGLIGDMALQEDVVDGEQLGAGEMFHRQVAPTVRHDQIGGFHAPCVHLRV